MSGLLRGIDLPPTCGRADLTQRARPRCPVRRSAQPSSRPPATGRTRTRPTLAPAAPVQAVPPEQRAAPAAGAALSPAASVSAAGHDHSGRRGTEWVRRGGWRHVSLGKHHAWCDGSVPPPDTPERMDNALLTENGVVAERVVPRNTDGASLGTRDSGRHGGLGTTAPKPTPPRCSPSERPQRLCRRRSGRAPLPVRAGSAGYRVHVRPCAARKGRAGSR
jgi:hypothetical protein